MATEASQGLFGRQLTALYAVNLCAGVSMAVFGMLTSTWMEESGCSKPAIGAVSASYYLLQILGALFAERLLRRYGVRGALAAGLAVAALASPAFVLTREPLLLGLLRAAAGLGVGIAVTAGQTGLLRSSGAARRGLVSGLHALAFALGLALGPLAGPPLYQRAPVSAAVFGGAVLALGLLVSVVALPPGLMGATRERFALAAKLRLPLVAIFAYGFAESTVFTLYPAVLVQSGKTVSQVGFILATFVLGSLVCTIPVAWLGERRGRPKTVAGCVLFGIVSTLGLCLPLGMPWLVSLAFVAGGSVGSSYALVVALVADLVTERELPSGMASFTVWLGAGCVAGPLVTGFAVELAGNAVLFLPTALCFGVVVAYLGARGAADGRRRRANAGGHANAID